MNFAAEKLEDESANDWIVPPQKIYVKSAGRKGKGVFARELIKRGEVIEESPIVPISSRHEELMAESKSPIADYVFAWHDEDERNSAAIGFGYLSLINHSHTPNVSLNADYGRSVMIITADRDIQAHEELSFDYGVPLWFEKLP